MRRKSLVWFAGSALALLAAFVIGHTALATTTDFGLSTPMPAFPPGGMANFDVSIPPYALGGHGELYVYGEDEVLHPVMSFPMQAPAFSITAPVPTNEQVPGPTLTFFYVAFDLNGLEVGESVAYAAGKLGSDWIE